LEREKLYHLVLELRKEGLSYNQIIRRIQADHGVALRKSHLSDWISGKHKPFGYVRALNDTPSPELGYVIGVKMGDASMSVSNYNYKIKLRVTDKEFAEEFSRCLSVILGRSPPRVKWQEKTRSWQTEASSMLLYNFLRQDLNGLTPTIEHCRSCKSAFLRGFFDSEGSVSDGSLTVSNGDIDKLYLVSKLLFSMQVENTGPHLARKGGGFALIKGKFYRRNKDMHYLYVRIGSWLQFQKEVGFTIIRKKQGLADRLSNRASTQP